MSYCKWVISLIILSLTLSACKESPKKFKVGVTAGPHAMIMEEVKKLAEAENFPIEVVEFNDFNLPNAALAQGDLDINIIQHEPFLNEQIKNRGYDLIIVGKSIMLPLGLYSNKIKNFNSIQHHPGAKIAIPNDPTNEGRALKLLEQAGLIKLKPHDNPTPLDIIENPLNFQFIEVEAPQLPRILADVFLAVINTDWIVLAGKDPRTALFHETAPHDFVNVIVARRQDKDNPNVARFLKVYQSEQVKKFIQEKFNGAVTAAW